jgi:hypothetical protein
MKTARFIARRSGPAVRSRLRGALAMSALAATLALGCTSCVPAVTSLAPTAVGATAFVGAQAQDKAANRGVGGPTEEQAGRCDALLRAVPGVEQVRKSKDGSIDSRRWRLFNAGSAPRWMVARSKTAPPDGWEPKPGIDTLKFTPPLEPSIDAGDSVYIIYAPETPMSIAESAQAANLDADFGDAVGHGSFQWHGRAYGFTLVKRLPCYPLLK